MQVLTVSQVNTYIKALLDEIPPIQNVYITGEISNFKHYAQSGHMYFTLKDEKSQIKCVMFAFDNYKIRFKPENGMKVICFGKVGVYERDGVYQLYCHDMQPQGVGALQIAFEQLKEKLSSEGLFDEEHKKRIPKYPNKIGVATSSMGAAVEDIKNIVSRRYPLAEIVIVPTIVQGSNSAPDIVKSIEMLDNFGDIDVIIVGRGGGSIEDLWAFNTEEVARAVYNCKTPVVSAVGHETDYTICDFVADLRAPTPSAAAELVAPDVKDLMYIINNLSQQVDSAIEFKLEMLEFKLKSIMNNPALANRELMIDNQIEKYSNLHKQITELFKNKIFIKEKSLSSLAQSVENLSPLNTLLRGYSLAFKDNELIKSVNDVKVNDKIKITLNDGSINAVVVGE